MKKIMQHPYTSPRGRKNNGGDLLKEITPPSWFADPNHRAKSVGNIMFELVKSIKDMNKLDALRIKKYYSFYVKQNRKYGIDALMAKRYCPIDHLFDDHLNCDALWCEKKRIENEKESSLVTNIVTPCKKMVSNEIAEIDQIIKDNVNMNNDIPITEGNDQQKFGRTTLGYYRSKVTDAKLYEEVRAKYDAYVTKEKLEECAHEFDSNINESLNNIVSKYAPKRKHFSKSLSLVTRVYIAAGVYLVGFHYLWSRIYENLI